MRLHCSASQAKSFFDAQFPFRKQEPPSRRNKTMGLGRRTEPLNLFYLAENMLGTQDA